MSSARLAFLLPLAISLLFTIGNPRRADAQVRIVPLPAGAPKRIAAGAIRYAGHACGRVLHAVRLSDGSTRAECSNGQRYMVFAVEENGRISLLAFSCAALAENGVSGC